MNNINANNNEGTIFVNVVRSDTPEMDPGDDIAVKDYSFKAIIAAIAAEYNIPENDLEVYDRIDDLIKVVDTKTGTVFTVMKD